MSIPILFYSTQSIYFRKIIFLIPFSLAGSIYTPKMSLQIPSKAAFRYPSDMFFSIDRKMSILQAHFFYGPKNTIFFRSGKQIFFIDLRGMLYDVPHIVNLVVVVLYLRKWLFLFGI